MRHLGFVSVCAIVHLFSHIKPLLDDYIDLKMESLKIAETLMDTTPRPTSPEVNLPNITDNLQFRVIPVFEESGREPVTETKVSLQDYDHLLNLTEKWYLNQWGHVVMRYETADLEKRQKRPREVRMARIIYDFNTIHINGDRLDNRRINLVSSRTRPDQDEDFKISTPRVVLEDFHNFRSDSKDLQGFTGFANIDYNGKKFYSGDIADGKPHGYGHLYEAEKHAQSCGMWKEGLMKKGMIAVFKPYPKCMCDRMKRCPLQEVEAVHVVQDGKIVS